MKIIGNNADVAKLVDALALGASEATLEGSSPSVRTKKKQVHPVFFALKLSCEQKLKLLKSNHDKLSPFFPAGDRNIQRRASFSSLVRSLFSGRNDSGVTRLFISG